MQLFVYKNDIEAFIEYRFTCTKSRGDTIDIQDNIIDKLLVILVVLD